MRDEWDRAPWPLRLWRDNQAVIIVLLVAVCGFSGYIIGWRHGYEQGVKDAFAHVHEVFAEGARKAFRRAGEDLGRLADELEDMKYEPEEE